MIIYLFFFLFWRFQDPQVHHEGTLWCVCSLLSICRYFSRVKILNKPFTSDRIHGVDIVIHPGHPKSSNQTSSTTHKNAPTNIYIYFLIYYLDVQHNTIFLQIQQVLTRFFRLILHVIPASNIATLLKCMALVSVGLSHVCLMRLSRSNFRYPGTKNAANLKY